MLGRTQCLYIIIGLRNQKCQKKGTVLLLVRAEVIRLTIFLVNTLQFDCNRQTVRSISDDDAPVLWSCCCAAACTAKRRNGGGEKPRQA